MGLNGEHRDSTGSGADRRTDRPPSNMSSSSRSTPSLKHKDGFAGDKPGTPGSKPTTPNGQPNGNGKPPTPGAAYPPGFPRPGEMPPMGFPPYQNGGPPPELVRGFPPRPPLVSDSIFSNLVYFNKHCFDGEIFLKMLIVFCLSSFNCIHL
jgi:hypothetical protein